MAKFEGEITFKSIEEARQAGASKTEINQQLNLLKQNVAISKQIEKNTDALVRAQARSSSDLSKSIDKMTTQVGDVAKAADRKIAGIPRLERKTIEPVAGSARLPKVDKRLEDLEKTAHSLGKSLKILQDQIIKTAKASEAYSRGFIKFKAEEPTFKKARGGKEYTVDIVDVRKLERALNNLGQKIDKPLRALKEQDVTKYLDDFRKLFDEALRKFPNSEDMAKAIALAEQRQTGKRVSAKDIEKALSTEQITTRYVKSIVEPELKKAMQDIVKTISIPAITRTGTGARIIETKAGAERVVSQFAKFERGFDKILRRLEEEKKISRPDIVELRKQIVSELAKPAAGGVVNKAQLGKIFDPILRELGKLNPKELGNQMAKAIATAEAKSYGGLSFDEFNDRVKELSGRTLRDLKDTMNKLHLNAVDVVNSFSELKKLNIYDVILQSLKAPTPAQGGGREPFDINFFKRIEKAQESSFRRFEDRINKIVQDLPVIQGGQPKLGLAGGETVGVLTARPQKVIKRGKETRLETPQQLLPNEAKAYIVGLNEEIRNLFADLEATGQLQELKKSEKGFFELLTTIGQSESIASDATNRIDELNQSLFKMTSFDIRKLGPFGEQFANLGRSMAQAQRAISGLSSEFPTLQSATERRLIQTGRFGQQGFGYNAITEIRHTAKTFEDQIEIAGKLAKAVSEVARQLVLPGGENIAEVQKGQLLAESPLARAQAYIEKGQPIPREVLNQISDIGNEIIKAFGESRKYEFGADRAFIEKVIQTAISVRGEETDVQVARIVEQFLAQFGRKFTTRFAAKGVSTFGIEQAPQAAAGGAKLKIAESLGTAKLPKTLGELSAELLQESFGAGASALSDRLVAAGNKFFIDIFEKSTPLLDELNKALGTSFVPSPGDIKKFKEYYLEQLQKGQESLFKEVPVEARISAFGLAKRGLQADILEQFFNNLTGAVQTVIPDKLDIEKYLGGKGVFARYFEALGFEKNVEEIARLQGEISKIEERAKELKGKEKQEAEERIAELQKLVTLEETYPAYAKIGDRLRLVGEKFLEIVEEPKLKKETSYGELAAGLKGEKINIQAYAALASIFGEQSDYLKELANSANATEAEAKDLLTAIVLMGNQFNELKSNFESLLPVLEVGKDIRPFKEGAVALEDIKGTLLDIAKFPEAFVLSLPKEAGGPLFVPGAAARSRFPEETTGAIAPSKLTRLLDNILTASEDLKKATTGGGELLDREQIAKNINQAFSTRIFPALKKAIEEQDLAKAREIYDYLSEKLAPILDKITVTTAPVSAKFRPGKQDIRGTAAAEEIKRFRVERATARVGGNEVLGELQGIKQATLDLKDQLISQSPIEIQKRIERYEKQKAAGKPIGRKLQYEQELLKFIPSVQTLSEEAIRGVGKVLQVEVEEGVGKGLENAVARLARARAKYEEELGTQIFGKKGVVQRAFFEKILPAPRAQVVALETNKAADLAQAVEAMQKAATILPESATKALEIAGQIPEENVRALQKVVVEQVEREKSGRAEGRPLLKEGEVALSVKKATQLGILEGLKKGKDVFVETLRFPVTGAPSFQPARARLMTPREGFTGPQFTGATIGLAGRPAYNIQEVSEQLEPLRKVAGALREDLDNLNKAVDSGAKSEEEAAPQRKALVESLRQFNIIIDKATAMFAPFEQNLDFDGDAIFVHAARTKEAADEIKQHYVSLKAIGSDVYAVRQALAKTINALKEGNVETLAQIGQVYGGRFTGEKGFSFLQRPHIEEELKGISEEELDRILAKYLTGSTKDIEGALKLLSTKLGKPIDTLTKSEKQQEVYNRKYAEDLTKQLTKVDLGLATESITRIARAAETVIGFGGGVTGKGGQPPYKGFGFKAGKLIGPDAAKYFQDQLNELLRYAINAALKTKHGGEPLYQDLVKFITSAFEDEEQFNKAFKKFFKEPGFKGLKNVGTVIADTLRDKMRALNFDELVKEAVLTGAEESKIRELDRKQLEDYLIQKLGFRGFIRQLQQALKEAAIRSIEVELKKEGVAPEKIRGAAEAQYGQARFRQVKGKAPEFVPINVLREITQGLQPLYTLRTSTQNLQELFRRLNAGPTQPEPLARGRAPEYFKDFVDKSEAAGQDVSDRWQETMGQVQFAADYLVDSFQDVAQGMTSSADAMTSMIDIFIDQTLRQILAREKFAKALRIPTAPGKEVDTEKLTQRILDSLERTVGGPLETRLQRFVKSTTEKVGVPKLTPEEKIEAEERALSSFEQNLAESGIAIGELTDKELEARKREAVALEEFSRFVEKMVESLSRVEFEKTAFQTFTGAKPAQLGPFKTIEPTIRELMPGGTRGGITFDVEQMIKDLKEQEFEDIEALYGGRKLRATRPVLKPGQSPLDFVDPKRRERRAYEEAYGPEGVPAELLPPGAGAGGAGGGAPPAAGGGAATPPGGGEPPDDRDLILRLKRRFTEVQEQVKALRQQADKLSGDQSIPNAIQKLMDALDALDTVRDAASAAKDKYPDERSIEAIGAVLDKSSKSIADYIEKLRGLQDDIPAADTLKQNFYDFEVTGDPFQDFRQYQELAKDYLQNFEYQFVDLPKRAQDVLKRIEDQGVYKGAPNEFRQALKAVNASGKKELSAWRIYHLTKVEYHLREAERLKKQADELKETGEVRKAYEARQKSLEELKSAQRLATGTLPKRKTTPYLTKGPYGESGRYFSSPLAEAAGIFAGPEEALRAAQREYKAIRPGGEAARAFQIATQPQKVPAGPTSNLPANLPSLQRVALIFKDLTRYNKELAVEGKKVVDAWDFQRLVRNITVLRGATESYLFNNIKLTERQRQQLREVIALLKDLEKQYSRVGGNVLQQGLIKVPKYLDPEQQYQLHKRNIEVLTKEFQKPLAQVAAEVGSFDEAIAKIGTTTNYTAKVFDQAGNVLQNKVYQFERLGDAVSSTGQQIGRFKLKVEDMQKVFQERRGLGQAFRRVILWGGAATVVYGTTRALKEMIDTIAEVESQMAQLRKVMNPVVTDFMAIQRAGVEMAKKFGVPIEQVVDAMRVFAQQGLAQAEVLDRTRISTLAANVTTLQAAEATEALTAATKVYETQGRGTIRFLDSWLEVESRHAITSRELALALQRAGAAAKNAGIEFDQLNALVTGIGVTTRQTGKEIGTSIRFIARRLTSAKAPAELAKVGIAAFGETGDIRGAYDILSDLADKWVELSQAQKLVIAQAIGGRRHYNSILVLMQNWREVTEALIHSQNSQGASMQRNQIIMETFRKKLAQLQETVKQTQLLFGEFALKYAKDFVDGARFVVEVINDIPPVLKKAGVAIAATYVLLNKGAGIVDRFADGWSSLINILGDFKAGPSSKGFISDILGSLGEAKVAKNIFDVQSSFGKLYYIILDVGRAFNKFAAGILGGIAKFSLWKSAISAVAGGVLELTGVLAPLGGFLQASSKFSLALAAATGTAAFGLSKLGDAGTGAIGSLGPLAATVYGLYKTLGPLYKSFKESNTSAIEFAEAQREPILAIQTEAKEIRNNIAALEAMRKRREEIAQTRDIPTVVADEQATLDQIKAAREFSGVIAKTMPEAIEGFDRYGRAILGSTAHLEKNLQTLSELYNQMERLSRLEIAEKAVRDLTALDEGMERFKKVLRDVIESFPLVGDALAKNIKVAPIIDLHDEIAKVNALLEARAKVPFSFIYDKPIEESRKRIQDLRETVASTVKLIQEQLAQAPLGTSLQEITHNLQDWRKEFDVLADYFSSGDITFDWQDILAAEAFRKQGAKIKESGESTYAYLKSLGFKVKQNQQDIADVFRAQGKTLEQAIQEGLVDPLQYTAVAGDIVLFTRQYADQFDIAAGSARVAFDEAGNAMLEYISKTTGQWGEMDFSDNIQKFALAIFSPTDFQRAVESGIKQINAIIAGAAAGIAYPAPIDLGARFYSQVPTEQLLATTFGAIPGPAGGRQAFGQPEFKKGFELEYDKYLRTLREYKAAQEDLQRTQQDALNIGARVAPEVMARFLDLQKVLLNETAVMNYKAVIVDLNKAFEEGSRNLQTALRQAQMAARYDIFQTGVLAGRQRELPTIQTPPGTVSELNMQQFAQLFSPEYEKIINTLNESNIIQSELRSRMEKAAQAQADLKYLKDLYLAQDSIIQEKDFAKYSDFLQRTDDKNTQLLLTQLMKIEEWNKQTAENTGTAVGKEVENAPIELKPETISQINKLGYANIAKAAVVAQGQALPFQSPEALLGFDPQQEIRAANLFDSAVEQLSQLSPSEIIDTFKRELAKIEEIPGFTTGLGREYQDRLTELFGKAFGKALGPLARGKGLERLLELVERTAGPEKRTLQTTGLPEADLVIGEFSESIRTVNKEQIDALKKENVRATFGAKNLIAQLGALVLSSFTQKGSKVAGGALFGYAGGELAKALGAGPGKTFVTQVISAIAGTQVASAFEKTNELTQAQMERIAESIEKGDIQNVEAVKAALAQPEGQAVEGFDQLLVESNLQTQYLKIIADAAAKEVPGAKDELERAKELKANLEAIRTQNAFRRDFFTLFKKTGLTLLTLGASSYLAKKSFEAGLPAAEAEAAQEQLLKTFKYLTQREEATTGAIEKLDQAADAVRKIAEAKAELKTVEIERQFTDAEATFNKMFNTADDFFNSTNDELIALRDIIKRLELAKRGIEIKFEFQKQFIELAKNLKFETLADTIRDKFSAELTGFLQGLRLPGTIEPGRPAPLASPQERVFARLPKLYKAFFDVDKQRQAVAGQLEQTTKNLASVEQDLELARAAGSKDVSELTQKEQGLTSAKMALTQQAETLTGTLQKLKEALDQQVLIEQLRSNIENMLYDLKKTSDLIYDSTSIEKALGTHPLAEVTAQWEDVATGVFRQGLDKFELELARVRKEKGFVPVEDRRRIDYQRKEELILYKRAQEQEKLRREVSTAENILAELYEYQNKWGIDVQNLMDQVRSGLESAGEVRRGPGGRAEYRGVPEIDTLSDRLRELAERSRREDYKLLGEVALADTNSWLSQITTHTGELVKSFATVADELAGAKKAFTERIQEKTSAQEKITPGDAAAIVKIFNRSYGYTKPYYGPGQGQKDILANFKQTGGNIHGPGGIDKVPAMLTAGEFVIKKKSVDKLRERYGDTILDYINKKGMLPGMQVGGEVYNNILSAAFTESGERARLRAQKREERELEERRKALGLPPKSTKVTTASSTAPATFKPKSVIDKFGGSATPGRHSITTPFQSFKPRTMTQTSQTVAGQVSVRKPRLMRQTSEMGFDIFGERPTYQDPVNHALYLLGTEQYDALTRFVKHMKDRDYVKLVDKVKTTPFGTTLVSRNFPSKNYAGGGIADLFAPSEKRYQQQQAAQAAEAKRLKALFDMISHWSTRDTITVADKDLKAVAQKFGLDYEDLKAFRDENAGPLNTVDIGSAYGLKMGGLIKKYAGGGIADLFAPSEKRYQKQQANKVAEAKRLKTLFEIIAHWSSRDTVTVSDKDLKAIADKFGIDYQDLLAYREENAGPLNSVDIGSAYGLRYGGLIKKMYQSGGMVGDALKRMAGGYGMGGRTKKIPAYRGGIRMVPSNQLAYLHGGEAVVPAEYNLGGLAYKRNYQAGGTVTGVDSEAITAAVKAGIESATVKAELDDRVVRLEDNRVQLDPGTFTGLKESINTAVGTGIENVSGRVSQLEGKAIGWERAAERHETEISKLKFEDLPAMKIEMHSQIHDKTEIVRKEMKDATADTASTLSTYDARINAQERNLLDQKADLNSTKGYLSNMESLAQRLNSELSRRQ